MIHKQCPISCIHASTKLPFGLLVHQIDSIYWRNWLHLLKKLTPSIDSKCFYNWIFMYSFTSFHRVETVWTRVCTQNTKIQKKPSHDNDPGKTNNSLRQKIACTSFFLAIVLATLYSTSLRERHYRIYQLSL